VNTRKSIGLFALIAALLAMAVSAGAASATLVVPPGEAIEAKSTQTLFLPDNAYNETFVKCTASVAKFTTPPGRIKGGTTKVGIDQNMNRTAIGTKSAGSGGVTTDLSSPPTFTGCQVLHNAEVLGAAVVEANFNNGAWSLTGNGITEAAGSAAIGVPKAGATIKALGATLTISPNEASAVFAPEFKNSTHELKVDSQISFAGGEALGLKSPAQFEATYVANHSLEILP
jgi:hypothetical protein